MLLVVACDKPYNCPSAVNGYAILKGFKSADTSYIYLKKNLKDTTYFKVPYYTKVEPNAKIGDSVKVRWCGRRMLIYPSKIIK